MRYRKQWNVSWRRRTSQSNRCTSCIVYFKATSKIKEVYNLRDIEKDQLMSRFHHSPSTRSDSPALGSQLLHYKALKWLAWHILHLSWCTRTNVWVVWSLLERCERLSTKLIIGSLTRGLWRRKALTNINTDTKTNPTEERRCSTINNANSVLAECPMTWARPPYILSMQRNR